MDVICIVYYLMSVLSGLVISAWEFCQHGCGVDRLYYRDFGVIQNVLSSVIKCAEESGAGADLHPHTAGTSSQTSIIIHFTVLLSVAA